MRRFFPELLGAAMVVVGLAAIGAILWAGSTGPWAWFLVGALLAVGVALGLFALARQSRATTPTGRPMPFDGGVPPAHDGVHRVLAVVDEACSEDDVAALLLSETATETVAYVVAPALSSRLERWTADEHAYQAAQKRLDATVAALARHGITASGHVGSHDPLQAADDGLREFAADEIVFVVHPDAESDWLQRGVVELAEQRYPVPVRRLRPAAKV